jgi:hypothetical protein
MHLHPFPSSTWCWAPVTFIIIREPEDDQVDGGPRPLAAAPGSEPSSIAGRWAASAAFHG